MIAYKFIGKAVGKYVSGIPARDLTKDEIDRYGGAELIEKYPDVYEKVETVTESEDKEPTRKKRGK